MTITADVKCYYCGHISGQITGEMGKPFPRNAFKPAEAHQNRAIRPGERMRCFRCSGPVFLEDIQYVRRPAKAPADLSRRRRSNQPMRKAS